MEAPPTNSWDEDVNANCHGIFNLKSINCIPFKNFLTNPLKVDVDAATHIIYNVGKILIGSTTDDGSGALLQVQGEINAQSYMVNGVEFAAESSNGLIDLTNINNINGQPPDLYAPGGIDGSVQFNDEGTFDGDNYFVYNEITHALRINLTNPSSPAWQFEVGGDINIVDPTYLGYAYRINGIPFAIANSNGATIDLVNISTINGQPPGGGGSGTPTNVVGGICINVDNTVPGTAVVNANIGCIQTPWRQNIDAAGFALNNIPTITGSGPSHSLNIDAQYFTLGVFGVQPAIFAFSGGSRIGIANGNPVYTLDVGGSVNSTGCYLINAVPFACSDGAGGINLSNVTNINGVAPGLTPPAPPNMAVQWDNAGVFGGSGNFVWDDGHIRLGVGTSTPQVPFELYTTMTNNSAMVRYGNPFAIMEFGGDYQGFWIDSPSYDLLFRTAYTERVRITTTGLVGINTGTPAYRLDVVSADNAYVARFTNAGSFSGIIIDHTDPIGGESVVSFRDAGGERAVIEYDSDEDGLNFWTGGRDAAMTALTCSTDSFVGVRWTSPEVSLDVGGNVFIRGAANEYAATGEGVAISYSSGIGKLYAYNNDLNEYTELQIFGSTIQFWPNTNVQIPVGYVNVGPPVANMQMGDLSVVEPNSPGQATGKIFFGNTGAYISCNGTTWTFSPALPFTSSQWTNIAGGGIYYNGGNVGIGIAAPAYKFQVEGGRSFFHNAVGEPFSIGLSNWQSQVIWLGVDSNNSFQVSEPAGGRILTLSTVGALYVNSNITAGGNLYANSNWLYFASGAVGIYWDGGYIHHTHAIYTDNTVVAASSITAGGDLYANNNHLYFASGGVIIYWDGGNIVHTHPVWCSSNFQVQGNAQFTGLVGMGWGVNGNYRLNCDSAHFSTINTDSDITAQGNISAITYLNTGANVVFFGGINSGRYIQWTNNQFSITHGISLTGNINITGQFQYNGATWGYSHVYGNNNDVGTWWAINFKDGTQTQINITGSPTVGGALDIWYSYISDARVKENVLPLEGGVSIINQLKPISAEFNGLARFKKGGKIVSVLAQDLMEVLPDAVSLSAPRKLHPEDEEAIELFSIDTSHVLFHAVLAIQQLDKRLKALEN